MKLSHSLFAATAAGLAAAAPAAAHETGEPHVHGVLAEIGHMMGHVDFWLVAAAVAALAGGIAVAIRRRKR